MRDINFLKSIEDASLACTPDENGHCITCSDEAQAARVLQIDSLTCTALVVVGGEEREVDISLLDEVTPGDLLLVHGGVALSNQAAGD